MMTWRMTYLAQACILSLSISAVVAFILWQKSPKLKDNFLLHFCIPDFFFPTQLYHTWYRGGNNTASVLFSVWLTFFCQCYVTRNMHEKYCVESLAEIYYERDVCYSYVIISATIWWRRRLSIHFPPPSDEYSTALQYNHHQRSHFAQKKENNNTIITTMMIIIIEHERLPESLVDVDVTFALLVFHIHKTHSVQTCKSCSCFTGAGPT